MTTPADITQALEDWEMFVRFIQNPSNIHPFVQNDFVKKSTIKTIRALLEAAQKVDAEKLREAADEAKRFDGCITAYNATRDDDIFYNHAALWLEVMGE